jgi:hypothetical protein
MMCKVLADPANDIQAVVDSKKAMAVQFWGRVGFKYPQLANEEMSTENSNSWLRVSEKRIITIRGSSTGAKCFD